MNKIKAVAIIVLITFSMTALAGATNPKPVTVNTVEQIAWGDMWTARSSDNESELIGCAIGVNNEQNWDYGYCQAQDADGNFIGCFTWDPNLAKVIHTITPYSYIEFETDGVQLPEPDFKPLWYTCTAIFVSNNSFYLPFTPTEKEKDKGK